MSIIPNDERVLVKPILNEPVSKAGIITKTDQSDKPERGVIVEVGDGEKAQLFRKGATILFNPFAPKSVIDTDGTELLLVPVSDILAIIE